MTNSISIIDGAMAMAALCSVFESHILIVWFNNLIHAWFTVYFIGHYFCDQCGHFRLIFLLARLIKWLDKGFDCNFYVIPTRPQVFGETRTVNGKNGCVLEQIIVTKVVSFNAITNLSNWVRNAAKGLSRLIGFMHLFLLGNLCDVGLAYQ